MWVELDQNAPSPRQVRLLADSLGLEATTDAATYLARLERWMAEHAAGGVLTGLRARTLATAAGWRGDPATLVEGLARARLLDRHPSGVRLDLWGGSGAQGRGERWDSGAPADPLPAAPALWQAALAELRDMVNRANFAAFLADTRGLSQHGAWFVVGTPAEYVRDVLTARFRATIERALYEVAGRVLHARFVVCLPGDDPPSPPAV